MTELENIFDVVDTPQEATDQINKREFLVNLIYNGEGYKIPGKTPWTIKRLQKASDKKIDSLYDSVENPPMVNKQEALTLGMPVCPVVIDMYAEGLKSIISQMPYIGSKYTINAEKLKANLSGNEIFYNNLAVKIGSKMIENMGNGSSISMGISLASMTWGAVESVKPEIADPEEKFTPRSID